MSGRDVSSIQEIKNRLNLAELARRYMDLRRAGSRWVGLCPFHQEKTPSFSINEEEGLYYCFGCQASGDLIDFYSKINGLEFREALEQLAEEAGVELTLAKPDPKAQKERQVRLQCFKMYDLARKHFRQNLRGRTGKECRTYIEGRKLAPEIVDGFEIGWAQDEWQALSDALGKQGYSQEQAFEAGLLSRNDKGRMYDRFRKRLIFPIHNLSGQVIAFGGRVISGDDQPKYINSTDTPIYHKSEHLYGLFQARRAISSEKRVLLTEGYMDVLTLHQFGYENACGVLGTALTTEQVKRLGGFCSHVDLIFDGDTAGRKAALRSCEMIMAKGMHCRVILMPDGEDIDSLLQSQGKDAFESLRKKAFDGIDYCVETVSGYAPREILDWVTSFLKSLDQPELGSFYISRLAGGLGLREDDLRASIMQGRGQRSYRQPQQRGGYRQQRPSHAGRSSRGNGAGTSKGQTNELAGNGADSPATGRPDGIPATGGSRQGKIEANAYWNVPAVDNTSGSGRGQSAGTQAADIVDDMPWPDVSELPHDDSAYVEGASVPWPQDQPPLSGYNDVIGQIEQGSDNGFDDALQPDSYDYTYFDDAPQNAYHPAPYNKGWNNRAGKGGSFTSGNIMNTRDDFRPGKSRWKKGGRRDDYYNTCPEPKPELAASLEERVLDFVVRFPHRQKELEEHGAREFMESPWALGLWDKLSAYDSAELSSRLEGKEKDFWVRHRVTCTVPPENELVEFEDVVFVLRARHIEKQGKSLVAAMRHIGPDDEGDADIEFLRTLNESLGRSNGEY